MVEKNVRDKLILTADDFGKSEIANKNILYLVEAGKLDRVSVMVGGILKKEEVERLLSAGVNLDIHLELVWQKRRRNLLKDHTLRQLAVFFVNYLWGDWPVPAHPRSGKLDVEKEWQNQIEKFKKIFGRMPDGISSHEHVHYFPPYFSVTLQVANHYKIPFIRFGKKGFVGKKTSVYLILKAMHWLNKKNFLRSKISSSDYFASLDWLGNFDEFLNKIKEGEKIEIACHPEREDEYTFINNL
jgi:predicted glycoside hydrolase/deacetylase ChbG (UPF0249 family)